MTVVAEGIHRLANGVSNFYLVEESGKLVLMDAGASRDWHLPGRVVRELGRDPGDLDAVRRGAERDPARPGRGTVMTRPGRELRRRGCTLC